MADPIQNGTPGGSIGPSSFHEPTLRLKLGLAEMLKGGVIMDVMNVEQARIAEEAGAISVMALERVPAMIRAEGGVARMANPKLIRQIMAAVTIPVMAKAGECVQPTCTNLFVLFADTLRSFADKKTPFVLRHLLQIDERWARGIADTAFNIDLRSKVVPLSSHSFKVVQRDLLGALSHARLPARAQMVHSRHHQCT